MTNMERFSLQRFIFLLLKCIHGLTPGYWRMFNTSDEHVGHQFFTLVLQIFYSL